MAVSVRFGRASINEQRLMKARIAESVAESGTAASTTATANLGEIAEIVSLGANAVYARKGATASASNFDVAVPAGGVGYIVDCAAGDAISIIAV